MSDVPRVCGIQGRPSHGGAILGERERIKLVMKGGKAFVDRLARAGR